MFGIADKFAAFDHVAARDLTVGRDDTGQAALEIRHEWSPPRNRLMRAAEAYGDDLCAGGNQKMSGCEEAAVATNSDMTCHNSECPRRESNSQLKDFKSFASAVGLLGLDAGVYVPVVQPSCSPVRLPQTAGTPACSPQWPEVPLNSGNPLSDLDKVLVLRPGRLHRRRRSA